MASSKMVLPAPLARSGRAPRAAFTANETSASARCSPLSLGDADDLHQRGGMAGGTIEDADDRCDHAQQLPSADKHDRVHDMSLVVGFIHAQRDRGLTATLSCHTSRRS